MLIVKSLLYFLLAGLCEIGGGYLMWLWLREGRSLLFGLSGAAILIVYGIVPTLQPEGNFGRVYAAYGGIFIALSILWGWLIDNVQPDRFDIIGGIVALTGVAIIMYAPRCRFRGRNIPSIRNSASTGSLHTLPRRIKGYRLLSGPRRGQDFCFVAELWKICPTETPSP